MGEVTTEKRWQQASKQANFLLFASCLSSCKKLREKKSFSNRLTIPRVPCLHLYNNSCRVAVAWINVPLILACLISVTASNLCRKERVQVKNATVRDPRLLTLVSSRSGGRLDRKTYKNSDHSRRIKPTFTAQQVQVLSSVYLQ